MKRLATLTLAVLIASVTPAGAVSTLSASDASRISTSYTKLTNEFYKKVEPQAILDSVDTDLDKALAAAHVKYTLPKMESFGTSAADIRSIDLAVTRAAQKAAGKISAHDLSYDAIAGIMDSVHDRYTVFLNPKDYADLNSGLDGQDFGGTGIVIQADDTTHYIVVSNVVPDGPAEKAGIQQDDVIVGIDGASTKGWSIDRASGHLRGKEGTTVTLTVQRDGKNLPNPVTLTRAKIHQLSVFDKMLKGDVGYVALTVFGADTARELSVALDRLHKRGARAYIMDLRENGGGYLEAAVGVSSKFISSGPIVSVESRASTITTHEADNDAINPVPLAVLVNGHTASASEITSGAIQDSGVGTIIGTKTFGKGVVQTIFPLGDGSAVKITTARYLTPHNRDINHLGITPDIVIAENQNARFGEPTKDAQLARALQFVTDRVAHLNEMDGGTAPGNY